MENEWKIRIIDPGYKLDRDIYIFRKVSSRETMTLDGQILVKGSAMTPTMSLNSEQLQSFADALNEIGFKPKQGFLEGKLESTERHLEDMRNLVFKNKK